MGEEEEGLASSSRAYKHLDVADEANNQAIELWDLLVRGGGLGLQGATPFCGIDIRCLRGLKGSGWPSGAPNRLQGS